MARQLSEFDLKVVRFNPVVEKSLVSCGFENIRLWRIKNNVIPAFSVSLNNNARGKRFNNIDFVVSEEKNIKKATHILVTTDCGLMYKVTFVLGFVDLLF